MTGKFTLAAVLVAVVLVATQSHAAHFKLMPYPLYKDATSKELLVLGTQEARSVMQKVNEKRREGKDHDHEEKEKAAERKDEGVTVTRRWTPRQIVKEKDGDKRANLPIRRNKQLRTKHWYSFGWESQMLETGFLCVWLVPLLEWKAFPATLSPPTLNVIAFRWLVVRIMLGAGLIKIRGDRCWRDLTCMHYFYETQPNPNPVSYFAHHAPDLWHRFEVVGNHLVELGLPALVVLLPLSRTAGMANGAAQILFQGAIIVTGNLSFLNWLTAVPSLWFFDDACWTWLFSRRSLDARANAVRRQQQQQSGRRHPRAYVHLFVGILLASLSWPVVLNLFSARQVMNTSFEPLRLVNTYGAFGSVTKQRSEVILEGTHSADPTLESAKWLEYEFKCKPGSPSRRPCLISPYHYRLDWLMWFAAFQDLGHNPWLVHLAGKMLDNDPALESLLAANPFEGKRPPKYVRASLYRYTFATPGSSDWWNRSYSASYMPAVSKRDLQEIYQKFGWKN